MKIGIIGLPQSGRFTVFKALTGAGGVKGREGFKTGDQLLLAVNVPDERVDSLTELFHPKKTIYAQVEYLLLLVMDCYM
jgi:ribosome-binding ATPase YchF (GTP1/OBG family)